MNLSTLLALIIFVPDPVIALDIGESLNPVVENIGMVFAVPVVPNNCPILLISTDFVGLPSIGSSSSTLYDCVISILSISFGSTVGYE